MKKRLYLIVISSKTALSHITASSYRALLMFYANILIR